MHILIIADTDLDGAGTAAIINWYHKCKDGALVSTEFPNRKKLNRWFEDTKTVKRWAAEYDLIYLCDTGLDTLQGNKNLGRILGPKALYFDHHQTNYERSKKYADNFLKYHVEEGDRCTAKIAYDVLLDTFGLNSESYKKFKTAGEFATLVNDFDLWIRDYNRSVELADVVAVLGPDHAFWEFIVCVDNAYYNSEVMEKAIETARMRKFKSLQLAKSTLIYHSGYKVPIQTAISSGYGTEVGSQLVDPRGIIILYDTISNTTVNSTI